MSRLWRRHRYWLAPTLFILPGALLFGIVIILASVQTIWVSLFEWDGVGPMQWVGLANYKWFFNAPEFWLAIGNTLALVLGVLALSVGEHARTGGRDRHAAAVPG